MEMGTTMKHIQFVEQSAEDRHLLWLHRYLAWNLAAWIVVLVCCGIQLALVLTDVN